jgi:YgiT-type zinc finger domain-containing protein
MALDICPMCYGHVVVNCQDTTFKHKEHRIVCQNYISYQCQQCGMEFVKAGEKQRL